MDDKFYRAIKEILKAGYTIEIDDADIVGKKNRVSLSIGILNEKGKIRAKLQVDYLYDEKESYFKGISTQFGDLFFLTNPSITPFLTKIMEI